ncbi:excinuclease ABC subunit B [Candidatus Berkelbacteria bacterium CG_4_9_14_0_2_um_filter_42_30]|uniref:UvrABC system protein B n=4 Tax=Candidatus Berkelbacteria TaxID=1618330 RepID=A0A2M7K185_9BACT|nr:MAG: excinuclease ABC subunit B [Candidatus Berkelbacteria bacterium CG1_02_42_45]PIR27282.1 MAG: excinuclease ABC subunit B [Candidatus Berkelbacteria bacterium CG11_big_fil_rev_8_21_14_0_20_42_15]PIX30028.1 MAG: excinuclease ABC subunit B [Candidatus Berkelbacteria bacterium CG_4_8_14_3_um_filter_42_13]PJC65853.1 MAG: excinuclease ABC subunit B [Candidatus Berkelbacteria bacterium CG_4_9_14_0_2_um_filter_42_30]
MSIPFKLKSKFSPTGDQPQAIEKLSQGIFAGKKFQTLLGVTGSGKTFTIANVIEKVQKPTLVIAHNKTLAAQLADEFREFFPDNAVHYFVSYYDYYQPEAYIPASDTYIEKDSSINDEIDRLRHAATQALLTRSDVIIVASVSCIYGIGSPENYQAQTVEFNLGEKINRREILAGLTNLQYARNDYDLRRGTYRVKGEAIEIYPAYTDFSYKIIFFGDEVESIEAIDSLSGKIREKLPSLEIYPAKHFITPNVDLKAIISQIEKDLKKQIAVFEKQNKLIEAQRIEERVKYDIEMLRETGYCTGIENYSRYFDGRKPGQPPSTLIDFFPKDYLLVVDESHMTIPQIHGMYGGDRSRKETLVEYGFRLPAAIDNRPLKYDEFYKKINQVIFSSATPDDYELELSKNAVSEQLIRPTGVVDPGVFLRPAKGQIPNLISEIEKNVSRGERIIVTTLTKRMAEDLTEFLLEKGLKVAYLHSDIATLERPEILRNLRRGKYDVVIGINLLREGIDLPEVSLVAILDADKEGFLRGKIALIQTIGRAARHTNGRVIMYADRETTAMKAAIFETNRRRKVQQKYNRDHHITAKNVERKIIEKEMVAAEEVNLLKIPKTERTRLIRELKKEMQAAALKLQFERAAELRDEIISLDNDR